MKTTSTGVVKFNSFERAVPVIILREGSQKTKILLLKDSTTHDEGEVIRVWNRMIVKD